MDAQSRLNSELVVSNMVEILQLATHHLQVAVNATVANSRRTVQPVLQVRQARMAFQVMTAKLENQETLELPEKKFTHNINKKAASNAKPDQLDRQDRTDKADPQDHQEMMVNQDLQATQDNKDHLDLLVMQAHLEMMVLLVNQVNQALLEPVQVNRNLDRKDPLDLLDLLETLDLMVKLNLEPQDPLDLLDHLDKQEIQDLTVNRADQATLALREPTQPIALVLQEPKQSALVTTMLMADKLLPQLRPQLLPLKALMEAVLQLHLLLKSLQLLPNIAVASLLLVELLLVNKRLLTK